MEPLASEYRVPIFPSCCRTEAATALVRSTSGIPQFDPLFPSDGKELLKSVRGCACDS